MHPYEVLRRPVLSEKSNEIRENSGKYVFEVALKATKKDITKAVERMWEVKVKDVKTLVRRGKIVRRGVNYSKARKEKRAFITLGSGDKIPVFEDQ